MHQRHSTKRRFYARIWIFDSIIVFQTFRFKQFLHIVYVCILQLEHELRKKHKISVEKVTHFCSFVFVYEIDIVDRIYSARCVILVRIC